MATFLEFDGENHAQDECTELFAQTTKPGEYFTFAWQLSDGTFADSDDVNEVTLYVVDKNTYDDIDDVNEVLTKTFFSTFGRETFGDDEIAMRETFNNWTDSLCKDGSICDDTYNECELDES